LNIQTFFEEVRIDDEVVGIKYFTALVEPKVLDSHKRSRQNLYLNALRTLPKVRVILGAYQDREVTCLATCRQRYDVPEEKKTDVNIAVHMIDDAINGRVDRIVIVSGDSDLEPAAAWIRKRYPKIKMTVYLPALEEEKKVRRNDYYESIGANVKFIPL
jgi:6-hydroxy-3-succinoylpyridine 3-monooxygenase